ncbi:hypothetical protein JKP09_18935 [Vibrio vulnificus]|uniref:hypothetical protein n=1 Tax=Vibrio vulnificus TaxID=672 RepID=UPI001CDCE784|nr:hypothetical protein [Vibrio vulnificus]MCA3940374.1 hypothetical protein [Vibrio vulnificus]
MSTETFLFINKHPIRLVFDRSAPNAGVVNIHCEENNFCQIVRFLTSSLIFFFNEVDLDYSLNLSTESTIHGLTFDEIESILNFYEVNPRYSLSVCEASK